MILALAVLYSCGGQKEVTQTLSEKEKQDLAEAKSLTARENFINASKEKIIGNDDKALSLYKESLEADPNNAAAYYEMARILKEKKERSKAQEYAKKAVEMDPSNVWYQSFLGELYLDFGSYAKAADIFGNLIQERPKNYRFYYEKANALIRGRKYEEAIEVYDQLEKEQGIDPDISIQKQRLYTEIGKTDKAIREIEALIQAFPGQPEYYGILAELHLSNNDEKKALEAYERMVEVDPDNGKAHLSLSQFYRKKGKNKKALKELKLAFKSQSLGIDKKVKVLLNYYSVTEFQEELKGEAYELLDLLIKVHPQEAKAYTVYGDFLYRDEKLQKARKNFKKAVGLDASKFPIWQQILVIDSRLGGSDSLLKDSRQAQELFPNQPLTYFFEGVALIQKGRTEEAIEPLEYGRSLVVDNDDLEWRFHQKLAEAYHSIERHKESDKAFEAALEIQPDNAFMLNNYSYYLSLRKDSLEKAKKLARKANELKPGRPSFQDTYGWILYQKGEYEKAKKWLKKALENGGKNDGTILEHYGDVLYKMGEESMALEFWNKAKEAGGASEMIDKKIEGKKLYE